MKEIIEKLLEIIENAKGAREVIEAEFKKYYEINKSLIDEATLKMKKQIEEAMAKIPNPQDIGAVMQEMVSIMSKMMGEENFKKMMEFQSKYPFLKDMTKIFVPDK